MKYAFIFFLATLFYTNSENTKDETYPPFVVFQLFTSQGCSSCPPADYLLEQVKKNTSNTNIIVMSYHVDYWDRLGWKDPFSKRTYTELQYNYARKFNSSSVYTPQLVVNGNEHFTGSNNRKLNRALKKYTSEKASNAITLSNVYKKDRLINIDYKIKGDLNDKTVSFALVLEEKTTFVKRGENSNRKIKNSNIVINQVSLPVKGKANGNISLNIPENFDINDNYRIIAFVQNPNLQITGGVQKSL
ncbi:MULTISPECIES: DUF1223 domain-containing protein [unclassified Tenacibaculum]|uniref:DUF1223 domain-containing protein n=1 Tax=unclassified Tenacibaculum TaxID=2635139 RepID=UPI001F3193B4|nr:MULTISPECIES: DUF1223 domain-containing protein [unclassified Tenacibaculum]MCF2873582.1 DUF1223 domain-containing protein [Tenacibaculum sp. Cn5-1]MCF2933738.1 DUF1223 domain-containing protein [Tenacibaculum sp. Cn5-34]MCG7509680.1 DUF1223 domain-containing protein [Tenacibaculum sp. Cn5-46]